MNTLKPQDSYGLVALPADSLVLANDPPTNARLPTHCFARGRVNSTSNANTPSQRCIQQAPSFPAIQNSPTRSNALHTFQLCCGRVVTEPQRVWRGGRTENLTFTLPVSSLRLANDPPTKSPSTTHSSARGRVNYSQRVCEKSPATSYAAYNLTLPRKQRSIWL